MFYLCDKNIISYLTIFTGQVIQETWAVYMIIFTLKSYGWSRGDGLREKTLCICIQDNNKGFINLDFMHKLYWMKTEWGQARF